MRIAVPTENGRLAGHFGGCPQVTLFTVSGARIVHEQILDTPPHEPGVLPAWLRQQGANVVIAGGMGQRALALFAEAGIRVVVGAPSAPTTELAAAYLSGKLGEGTNACSHGPDHQCQSGR